MCESFSVCYLELIVHGSLNLPWNSHIVYRLTPTYIAQAPHCDTESCMFPYLLLRQCKYDTCTVDHSGQFFYSAYTL